MSINGIKYDDLEYWNDDNVDSNAYSKGKLFFSSVGLLTIFMNDIIRNIYHFLCILGYILIFYYIMLF